MHEFQSAYHTPTQSSTLFSLFPLVYGRELRTLDTNVKIITHQAYRDTTKDFLERAVQIVRLENQNQQTQMRDYFKKQGLLLAT